MKSFPLVTSSVSSADFVLVKLVSHVTGSMRIKMKVHVAGWVCVPLVVEVFGGWGNEAQEALSRVAKKLAIRASRFWPEVLASIYCDAPEC